MLLFIAGVLLLLIAPAYPITSAAIRWTGILSLAIAGLRGSSLTFWIFFAMFAGLQIGLDQP